MPRGGRPGWRDRHRQAVPSNDRTVKISKCMTYLLRHGAEKVGFTFLPGGFLYIDDVLQYDNMPDTTMSEVLEIVANDPKERFCVEKDRSGHWKIRANQGHSLQVDVDLQEISHDQIPRYPICLHGTNYTAWRQIQNEGLRRQGRQHVHFATGEPGEEGVISGMRTNCTVYIYVNLKKAQEDGIKFYISKNNVILSPGNKDGLLPVKYFDKVLVREKGSGQFKPVHFEIPGDESFQVYSSQACAAIDDSCSEHEQYQNTHSEVSTSKARLRSRTALQFQDKAINTKVGKSEASVQTDTIGLASLTLRSQGEYEAGCMGGDLMSDAGSYSSSGSRSSQSVDMTPPPNYNTANVFARILRKELISAELYADDKCIAIRDVSPSAPVHFLVIPRKPLSKLTDATEEDEALLGHLLLVANKVADIEGVTDAGFRVIINTGRHGGQEIPHVHVHVLGGERLPFFKGERKQAY